MKNTINIEISLYNQTVQQIASLEAMRIEYSHASELFLNDLDNTINSLKKLLKYL